MRLAVFSSTLAVVAAQQQIQNPIQNFCRRHQHQTCVIDSKIYTDGGLIHYNQDRIPQRNTWLLYGDLSNLTNGFPPQYDNLTVKTSEVPTTSGGVLWPDQANKLFYIFGGEYSNSTVQTFNALWFFDTIYNTWNRSNSDGSQALISWPAFGAGTINEDGIGYYYGGYLNNRSQAGWNSTPHMLNSLISYDMSTRRWSNFSTDAVPRAEGTLQYIPASDRGMLVYFGGLLNSSDGTVIFANMSQIHMLDIASTRWYTQTATGSVEGEIPQPRRGFCAGAAWAEDRSSYNIYVYGGIGANGTALGDLWILSLPSFKWIAWYPYPPQQRFNFGKAWSSCNVISKSQMIVMGGFVTNASRTECDDPLVQGQHGILLGQESIEENALWHRLMANVSTYRVPRNISAVIGGGVNGSATLTAPSGGFASSDLTVYFRTKYSAQTRSPTRSIPTTTAITIGPTPTSTSSGTHSGNGKPNIAAIAGGTVGAVVVIVCAVLLACFCLRSRRNKRQKPNIQELPAPPPPMTSNHHRNSNLANKSIAHLSVSQGSTLHSPHLHSPTYSPHGSPPPLSDHHTSSLYHDSPINHHYSGSDWNQQAGLGFHQTQVPNNYQETYYPPPPDPSQSPSARSNQTMSVELPGIRSPANAELSGVQSPKPARGF
ncbi:hypothetical protein B0J11DRAFT_615097 [Dendryphion nanum]|uniref:Kelch repeat-containing protein n=1 Tax=Dendryphion nanum TaxID=256645 RepID=A0A9P9DVE8_9PLEO|nr:hypothetical protein B0J11DRAFT_615097 [Dendryphion nanum]